MKKQILITILVLIILVVPTIAQNGGTQIEYTSKDAELNQQLSLSTKKARVPIINHQGQAILTFDNQQAKDSAITITDYQSQGNYKFTVTGDSSLTNTNIPNYEGKFSEIPPGTEVSVETKVNDQQEAITSVTLKAPRNKDFTMPIGIPTNTKVITPTQDEINILKTTKQPLVFSRSGKDVALPEGAVMKLQNGFEADGPCNVKDFNTYSSIEIAEDSPGAEARYKNQAGSYQVSQNRLENGKTTIFVSSTQDPSQLKSIAARTKDENWAFISVQDSQVKKLSTTGYLQSELPLNEKGIANVKHVGLSGTEFLYDPTLEEKKEIISIVNTDQQEILFKDSKGKTKLKGNYITFTKGEGDDKKQLSFYYTKDSQGKMNVKLLGKLEDFKSETFDIQFGEANTKEIVTLSPRSSTLAQGKKGNAQAKAPQDQSIDQQASQRKESTGYATEQTTPETIMSLVAAEFGELKYGGRTITSGDVRNSLTRIVSGEATSGDRGIILLPYNRLTTKYNRLTGEANLLQTNIDKRERSVDRLKNSLSSKNADRTTIQANIRKINTDLTQMYRNLDSLDNKLRTLDKHLNGYQEFLIENSAGKIDRSWF